MDVATCGVSIPMSDLKFVLRVLARTPGFTITVILALAVGIGATTAIFSLVDGVLLRPLPYAQPAQLVMVWQDYTARKGPIDEWASPGNVRDWRAQQDVFSSVSALGGGDVLSFLRQLEEKLPAVPGASHAAFTSVLPLAPGGDSDTTFSIVGKPDAQEHGRRRVSWYRSITPAYFETMRMRMAQGRAPARGAPEAVVNEAFAKRYFDGEPVLGAQLVVEAGGTPLTIVGVVADARTRGPRSAARNEMFLPYQFMPEGTYTLTVRMRDGMRASAAIPAMRSIVSSIDPKVPLARPSTMTALQAEALAQPRLLAVLLAAFADGLRLGALGLVLGVAGAFAASGAIASLLYGVEPRDPATFAGAAAAIALTARPEPPPRKRCGGNSSVRGPCRAA